MQVSERTAAVTARVRMQCARYARRARDESDRPDATDLCFAPVTAIARRRRVLSDLIAADGAHHTASYTQLLAQLQPNAPTGQPTDGSEAAETLAGRLQDAAWKQLHIGHWAATPIIWRRLYERAGLAAVVMQLAKSGTSSNAVAASADASSTAAAALRTLDLCLLMGSQENTAAIQTLVTALESKSAAGDTPAVSSTASPAAFAPSGPSAQLIDGNNQEQPTVATSRRAEQIASPLPTSPAPHSSADAAVAAAAAPIPALACPPVLPTSELASPLARLTLPSLQMFERACMAARVPAIIEGAMDSWPCIADPDRRWSNLAYLRRMCGRRTVPVEIGGNYLSEDWSQQLMTMDEFMQQHILKQGEEDKETPTGEAEQTGAAAAGRSSAPAPPRPIGYLAQHRLLEQVPALRNDLLVPDYCLLSCPGPDADADADPGPPQVMAWFGPGGTVSPLHTDPTHNLLAQVVGSKYVRLYSAEHTPSLYPSSDLANTSSVDAERVDALRFPLARDLPYWEGILTPGSMLYIPPNCWHYIRSLSVSFSVSFWWG